MITEETKIAGKDFLPLSAEEMAAESGWSKEYVRDAMDCGFLNPPHFTGKKCLDGVELQPADLERVELHERVTLEKTKGRYPKESVREMAISRLVEEKKQDRQPIFYKWRPKTSKEVFNEFLDSPAGRRRMEGKLKKEIANIKRGGEWDDNPQGLHPMPSNYENVLWETTRQEAAKLQVRAITGDKEAANKYNLLRSKWPEQLPALDQTAENGKEKR